MQAGLKLMVICLSLASAEITGMSHHARLLKVIILLWDKLKYLWETEVRLIVRTLIWV